MDVDTTTLLIAAYAVYLAVIAYVYGRQRRWSGLAGWALLIGGAMLAVGGAGDWFAWGGLLWSFIAAFGLLLVVSDLYANRVAGRRRRIRQ